MDQEATARLAYSYWEDRGGQDGSPEEDWVNAEEDLGVLLDVQRLPFSSISMEAVTLKYPNGIRLENEGHFATQVRDERTV